jgi:hypothetical protein
MQKKEIDVEQQSDTLRGAARVWTYEILEMYTAARLPAS